MEKTNSQIIKKNATNIGLILGLSLALLVVVGYVVNLELFIAWWFGIFTMLLVIVFGIISVSRSKGLLNGIISFKEAFTSYFVTIAIGLLISTLVYLILFKYIDPAAATFIQEKSIEVTVGFMEKFGTPQADIDKAVEQIRNTDSYSMLNLLKSYLIRLALFSLFGLLIALIFRKKETSQL